MPTRSHYLLDSSQLQTLITAFPKYCAGVSLPVAGKTYTEAQAVTVFTSVADAMAATRAARAAWTAALEAEEKVLATDGEVAKGLRESAAIMLAGNVQALDALGIPARKKPRPLSAEARLAATAKAEATRKARGTMSAKQKALIVGDVTGVTVTPVHAATATASAGTSTPVTTASSTAAVSGTASAPVVSPATVGTVPRA